MALDPRAAEILSRGFYGNPLEPEECSYLLSFREKSPVASLTVTLADKITRTQCSNTGRIIAEMEVSTDPCPGCCEFCKWNESTCMERFQYMDDQVIGDLCAKAGTFKDVEEIRLSAIEGTPVDDLVHFVETAKSKARRGTVISVDFGDLGPDDCVALKEAGATVAYHSCRIGEGSVTGIKPKKRMETIQNLVDAGFLVTAGTEPVGPETSTKEIVDSFFSTLNTGVRHGEIRPKEPLPDAPPGINNSLSQSRLSQIRAVLTLGSSWKSQSAGGCHCKQPFLLSRNVVVARYDQKDWRSQTESARRKLFNAGFEHIQCADGSICDLTLAYLKQTMSL